jgi:ABC-type multidrug transport system ATPase subunit
MPSTGSEPSEHPIEATALRKSYGRRAAVDGVDLLVRTGEIYGFLGPNGAGKTTTMRMLRPRLGVLAGDAPAARVFFELTERSQPPVEEFAA